MTEKERPDMPDAQEAETPDESTERRGPEPTNSDRIEPPDQHLERADDL